MLLAAAVNLRVHLKNEVSGSLLLPGGSSSVSCCASGIVPSSSHETALVWFVLPSSAQNDWPGGTLPELLSRHLGKVRPATA